MDFSRKKTRSNSPAAIIQPEKPWHALGSEEALRCLSASPLGLAEDEAQKRLSQIGPNALEKTRKESALMRFLRQFNDPLIYVLLAAGVLPLLLQHWLDSSVIFGVVLINALVGFIQEGKAEEAMDAIRKMLGLSVTVRRQGRRRRIAAEELVPGDIVFLEAGDKVPADIRLVQAKNVYVNEAPLTGESVPVAKDVTPAPKDSPLAERSSMLYSGTIVTRGQCIGVVVATGMQTEIGRISGLLANVERLTTPLMQQMAQFGRWLSLAIVLASAAFFGYGILLRGYGWVEMFLITVGVAVAAIPEGLPPIVAITLAIGVRKMAGRNAIIRRLPAIETLGAITTICSDKTGTLTKNEMTAVDVILPQGAITAEGSGYIPQGRLLDKARPINPKEDAALWRLVRCAALCNDADLRHDDGHWKIVGDPMEAALVVLAQKAGLDPEEYRQKAKRLDVIPFDSDYKYMATLNEENGRKILYVKGAPERVLMHCGTQAGKNGAPVDLVYWEDALTRLAEQGRRVIACAYREMPADATRITRDDLDHELRLLGLVGLIDPPRPEVLPAIRKAYNAGIGIKMITGDHALTALAIAKSLEIAKHDQALTGQALDQLSEEELDALVQDTEVFARVTPEHKLLLVEALQRRRQIVAMTGDGVNDAPALKRADVGVAMGQGGTEAAKEAAEMVLADDNFATIVSAVEEGRTIYDNIRKAILFIFPTNGAETFSIVIAMLLGLALPFTPPQILWINMITAVTLALSLAFEPAENDVMARPPRPPKAPLLNLFFLWRIVFVTAIAAFVILWLFGWAVEQGRGEDLARTMTVNALVFIEAFYLLNSRFFMRNSFSCRGLMGNRIVLYAIATIAFLQLCYTHAWPFQALFQSVSLTLTQWGMVLLCASSVFFLVEIEKWLLRACKLQRLVYPA